MGEDQSSSNWSSTTVTDLDMDALTRCASYLSVRDISNLAMSCKYLNRVAYADSIWQSLYRQEWPHIVPLPHEASNIREAYMARHTALHQFKFVDPLLDDMYMAGKPPQHILLERNNVIFSQGPSILCLQPEDLSDGGLSCRPLGNHNARVTCMRLFSPSDGYRLQSESGRDDNILITSSSDHFVRLWSKGGNRCFKGHTGPVLTLSDKLLGDDTGKVFASGGEDGTVRLWSINSSGKRGQHALKATLHGHEKAVSLMSVAGHRTSLLVSISKNGKVKAWDTTTASSSIRSSCCVGMISVPLAPVGMKCHESLLYVATGSSVTAVDLRTMQKAFTVVQQAKVHSFEMLPSKSVLCTGGIGRAMVWDIRRASSTVKVDPTIELDGHVGPVKHLHMDSYKIVTGGPDDPYVNVWEADSGKKTNSLISSPSYTPQPDWECSAMAVDGCRIVTACALDHRSATLCMRDFKTATCHVSSDLSEASSAVSKFWDRRSDSDSEEVDL